MALDFILPIIHTQVGTPQISILNLGVHPERSLFSPPFFTVQHPIIRFFHVNDWFCFLAADSDRL